MERIRAFCASVSGPVYVIEEGGRFVQDACLAAGLEVKGKACDSTVTEWTPGTCRGTSWAWEEGTRGGCASRVRPPMICAGCPYRLTGEVLRRMKKRGRNRGRVRQTSLQYAALLHECRGYRAGHGGQ